MLESVPRYDGDRVARSGDRAVVVGGSMAGLLAARVLADAFEEVIVIEQNELSEEAVPRRGVPQSRHPHVLQEAGRATLEDLFLGFGEDLISAGALMVDAATEFRFFAEGAFLADGPKRIPWYSASRPLFEAITRRRVADLDGVTLRGGCQFLAYRFDHAASAVDGLTVRGDDGEEAIDADLVVDATGRTSRTPAWLDEHGYRSPPTDEVHVDVAYSTLTLARPPADRRSILMLPEPPRTRGGALFPIESGEWLLTMIGVHGDHPSTDPAAFAKFASNLPTPEFGDVLDEHAVVSEKIHRYPFPSQIRRRYEDLDRFPDGLVAVGDAICSFNPLYGQGMSVAALEALQLHHELAQGAGDGLALRFFERAEGVVDDAWTLAVGADFAFPQTTGPKPAGTDVVNRYLARLNRKAHTDEILADAFARVVTMERRATTLFRPGIAWRVLRPTWLDDGPPSPAPTSAAVDDARRERDATPSSS